MLDVVTGQPAPFNWEEGQVQLRDIDLEPNTLRIFAVDISAPIAAVQHWFEQKRRYESRTAQPAVPEALPTPPATALVMDRFRFRQTDAAAKTNTAWLTEATDGSQWKDERAVRQCHATVGKLRECRAPSGG